MITHYILLLWFSSGHAYSTGIDHFDTLPECMAAAAALLNHDDTLESTCIPYEVKIE